VRGPDLGLFRTPHLNRGVGTRGPREGAAFTGFISVNSSITNNPLALACEFECQGIAVGMTRLMARRRPADGSHKSKGTALEATETRGLEKARRRPITGAQPEGASVMDQCVRGVSDPQGRIPEEGNFAVGMPPNRKSTQRSGRRRLKRLQEFLGRPAGSTPGEIRQIEQVFQEQPVVHRAAFLVSPVRTELSGEFNPQPAGPAQPEIRSWAFEEQTAKNNAQQIRQQMVRAQSGLEVSVEMIQLPSQRSANLASLLGGGLDVAGGQQQLAPTQNSQAGGVRIPAGA
jgi:hypothetical protein